MTANKVAPGDSNCLISVSDGMSDNLRFSSIRFQNGYCLVCSSRFNDVTKSSSHIENLKHFAIADACVLLDEVENGLWLYKFVNLETDLCFDAGEI